MIHITKGLGMRVIYPVKGILPTEVCFYVHWQNPHHQRFEYEDCIPNEGFGIQNTTKSLKRTLLSEEAGYVKE